MEFCSAVEALFKREDFKNRCDLRRMPEIGPDCLYVNSIYGVLRVAGAFKYDSTNRDFNIFFRGQAKDYGQMQPALLRGDRVDMELVRRRLATFHEHQGRVRLFRAASRFRGTIGGAILQHYDIPTAWLDLTDNLYVAAYFASIGCHKVYPIGKQRRRLGFIYCLRVTREYELTDPDASCDHPWTHYWCDLRKMHNPLSLRPHAQHAIYLSRPESAFMDGNIDLSDMVAGTIAFPAASMRCALDLRQFRRLLYPNAHDKTYKQLTKHGVLTDFKDALQPLGVPFCALHSE